MFMCLLGCLIIFIEMQGMGEVSGTLIIYCPIHFYATKA